jgi:uncharacterized phosphosugar-binding protein
MSTARFADLSLQNPSTEDYFYCKIELQESESIFLSSLFSDSLDKLLEEKYKIPIFKEKKYYPTIT